VVGRGVVSLVMAVRFLVMIGDHLLIRLELAGFCSTPGSVICVPVQLTERFPEFPPRDPGPGISTPSCCASPAYVLGIDGFTTPGITTARIAVTTLPERRWLCRNRDDWGRPASETRSVVWRRGQIQLAEAPAADSLQIVRLLMLPPRSVLGSTLQPAGKVHHCWTTGVRGLARGRRV